MDRACAGLLVPGCGPVLPARRLVAYGPLRLSQAWSVDYVTDEYIKRARSGLETTRSSSGPASTPAPLAQ
eukprot:3752051-Alexandrium_andersonii.AAC.1